MGWYNHIFIDLWGHGLSGHPIGLSQYEPSLFVSQARELLTYLGLNLKLHSLLGFSMGSLISGTNESKKKIICCSSVCYANIHREFVSKVVLLSPAGLAKSKPKKIRSYLILLRLIISWYILIIRLMIIMMLTQ